MKSVEIAADDKLYGLLLTYIAKYSLECCAFAVETKPSERKSLKSSSDLTEEPSRVALEIGFGEFIFLDFKLNKLFASHTYLGDPVGTNCGAAIYKRLIVYTTGPVSDLLNFMSELIARSEKSEAGFVNVYTWNPRRYYWQSKSKFYCRNLDSVVLPKATTSKIVDDVTHFLSEKARTFYQQHGIPYRRSYLLYGVPGAGKTSLIQAIAGHFKRSISYLQPTHPELTDDSLSSAMDDLAEDTIVVLEDIDALFTKDRANKVSKSNITFSGLLNALDGIGSSSGQLIFLTTNLRDQLDPALIRNGRVDFHVHFDNASDEQLEGMWTSYYPERPELAPEFRTRLREALGIRTIVTAGLQHFFVLNMNNTAEEALENIHVIIDDMNQKDVEAPAAESTTSSSASRDVNSEKVDIKQKKVKKPQKSGNHIHIHINDSDCRKDAHEETLED